MRIDAGFIFLVADGQLIQLLSSKRIVKLSNEEIFEFGITDLKICMDKLIIVGRDN
jgi:hypothetical protein